LTEKKTNPNFLSTFLISLGTFDQCSAMADKMSKKTVNPAIESDYERSVDDNQVENQPGKLPF
jgi:hypothetical protein